MHDLFITQHFDWDEPESGKARFVNELLRRLGFDARLVTPLRTGVMTNVEQRMNMFHLVSQVLAYCVQGDLVEVGSHAGSSAAVFQTVIERQAPERTLHVFDAFVDPPADVLLKNFQSLGLRAPAVHAGWFDQTIPAELPERVCFAHVDAGPGRSSDDLSNTVRRSLESLYPRMPKGAIGLFADYWDVEVFEREGLRLPRSILSQKWLGQYPQVRQECDAFFADKPEKIALLYSAEFAHGYFRKA
jgi:O-methyltransferase